MQEPGSADVGEHTEASLIRNGFAPVVAELRAVVLDRPRFVKEVFRMLEDHLGGELLQATGNSFLDDALRIGRRSLVIRPALA